MMVGKTAAAVLTAMTDGIVGRRTMRTAVVFAAALASSCGSWRSRPPDRWSPYQVREVVTQSPWVSLEPVRIMHPVKDGKRPTGHVRADRMLIRFCWVSGPVLQAFRLARQHGLGARPFRAPGLDYAMFFQTLELLQSMYGTDLLKDHLFVIVESQVLVDLTEMAGDSIAEKSFAESPRGVLPAQKVLYGIHYRMASGEIRQAKVSVKELQNYPPPRDRKVDESPVGRWKFELVEDYQPNRELKSIVLIFPRTLADGPAFTPDLEWVDIVVPVGNRVLRTRFDLKAMASTGDPADD